MSKKLPWYKRIFTTSSVEDALTEIDNPQVNMDDTPPKDPNTPWVTIKGTAQMDDNGSVALELDWNDAFIKYLKKNGFSGVDDEQLVLQYVAIIHRNLMTEMLEEINPYD